ncbi:MAG: ABC transporter substrate-binding protein [Xanthobacteraceae bacterium]
MKWRRFITLLGGVAVAWPLAARAQQPAMPVIGFLHVAFPGPYTQQLAAFRQGLKQSGYAEDQNLAVEYRWANNEDDRLPELAADLVRRGVVLIVAAGGPTSVFAAKAAAPTIPIVVVFGADPVRLGLVASLNRPGGNVTGVTFLTTELMAKRLEFLRALIPQATTIGYLAGPRTGSSADMLRETLAAADVLGLKLIEAEAPAERDFEPAFLTFVERKAGALMVAPTQLFDSNRDKVVELAARHKLPAVYQARDFVVDGGLMSYGAPYGDTFRVGGLYVGQILKGEKPATLPFQQATRLELVINLRTAKALGVEVPLPLMIRADEVIE